MKSFFIFICKICLILAILFGCEITEEEKETDLDKPLNQGIALLEEDQYEEGQYDRAIAFFNEALEINPRNADAYYNRGRAYYNKGQYDKAIADFTEAIEINPRNADARYNRGRMYYYKDQNYKAIADFTKAIEVNPRFVGAYHNRAIAYYQKGQYDKGCSDWKRACELRSCVQYELAKRNGDCK